MGTQHAAPHRAWSHSTNFEYGNPGVERIRYQRNRLPGTHRSILGSCPQDTEKADFLLRHGADAMIKSFDGQTAVHAAARSGSEQMVHLLLDYGANIHVVDKHNKLPLHVAVTRTWDNEYLLQLGSEISTTDC